MKSCKYFLMTVLLSTFCFAGYTQVSPPATATGNINGANISIKYNSPSVKGRQIWGGLVPYGKVWRAGANAATTFETDQDIVIGGKTLAAGKYSLYMIPTENEWTVIINSQTGQWGIKMSGETTENPEKDVIRVTVTPRKSANNNERLLYSIKEDGFVLSWENLEVPVSIKK